MIDIDQCEKHHRQYAFSSDMVLTINNVVRFSVKGGKHYIGNVAGETIVVNDNFLYCVISQKPFLPVGDNSVPQATP